MFASFLQVAGIAGVVVGLVLLAGVAGAVVGVGAGAVFVGLALDREGD